VGSRKIALFPPAPQYRLYADLTIASACSCCTC
jgi:hypothetical protein